MQKARGYTPPDPTFIPLPPVTRVRIFTIAPPHAAAAAAAAAAAVNVSGAPLPPRIQRTRAVDEDSRATPGTKLYMAFETEKKNGYAKTVTLQPEEGVRYSYLKNRAVWFWHGATGHIRPSHNAIVMVYCMDSTPLPHRKDLNRAVAPDFTNCDPSRLSQQFQKKPLDALAAGKTLGGGMGSDMPHSPFQLVASDSGLCLQSTLHTKLQVCGVGSLYKHSWGKQVIPATEKACLGVTLAECWESNADGSADGYAGMVAQAWYFEQPESVGTNPDPEALVPSNRPHPMEAPQHEP